MTIEWLLSWTESANKCMLTYSLPVHAVGTYMYFLVADNESSCSSH